MSEISEQAELGEATMMKRWTNRRKKPAIPILLMLVMRIVNLYCF